MAGGEFLTTAAEFNEFIRATRPQIVQPDITRCGGITEMRRIHHLTAATGVRCVPHGFSTGVLLAATVHFLASIPDGDLIEHTQSIRPLATDLVANKLPLIDGRVPVSDAPGLGVYLDEDLINAYRVDVTYGQ
ncbi:enolase C-terminal domain-like protein [Streptomyces sp. NPDC059255]|uniref:enolase C-terminal domain-like protein n=1 Tax=Streptomyces sp. NPDC059255 TaxID=3346793 RepID=UPI003691C728